MKKIVIGITGSIAAYKTCELISRLKKKNYNIEVIMTKKPPVQIQKVCIH